MEVDLTKTMERVHDAHDKAREHWHRNLNHRTGMAISFFVLPLILFYSFFIHPPFGFPKTEIITIESGLTVDEIAADLKEAQVVRSPLVLKAFVKALGAEEGVRAGDYQFQQSLTVFGVAKRIVSGSFGLEPTRIRVAEGATVEDIAIIFGKRLSRFNEDLFLIKARSLEGYLFPDTYFFLPNTTEDDVIKAMRNNFETHIADLQDKIIASGKTVNEIVVMASLLEKEARTLRDKQMIAGVLWKRLSIDMVLQVDATFVYFLGKNTFELTLEDLQHESPYNTYKHKGLPPGAIANPGYNSLLAALTPVEHDFLFYLADHSGVTHYSETYQEHLRKKRLYLD